MDREQTHTLTVEIPLALPEQTWLGGVIVKDVIGILLATARVAGSCGDARVTLVELDRAEETSP